MLEAPRICFIILDGQEASIPQGLEPSSLLAFCGTTEQLGEKVPSSFQLREKHASGAKQAAEKVRMKSERGE
jgi:hypothetical protein